MKKISRKYPQSVKVQRRIDEAVKNALAHPPTTDEFRRGYDTAQRDLISISKMDLQPNPQYVLGTLESFKYSGWLVQNWRSGWKWLSNWMFALIAYVAVYGLPAEVMTLIPEASQSKVIAFLSIMGMIFRFINQSRDKA